MMKVEGFVIDPPADFKTEEMTIGMRQHVPGAGNPMGAASLIVQSKKARAGATLDQLATETVVELTQSLPGMKNLTRSELIFADGGVGALLSYDWSASTGDLRQYFVLRQNGDRLCTMTITAKRDGVTAESAGPLMKTIASLRLA